MKTIQGNVAVDDRGCLRFINDFDPMEAKIRRFYQVENHRQGFVRAFHGHLKEGKYVYVNRGAAQVIALEMLPDGSDIVQGCTINKFILSAEKPSVLYIPPGMANGFKTLTPDAIVTFYSTSTLEESKGDDYRLNYNIVPGIWSEEYR